MNDSCSPTRRSIRVSSALDECDYKHTSAEHPFIQQLELARNEAIEVVSKRVALAPVRSLIRMGPKSFPIQALRNRRLLSFGLAAGSEELHPLVRATPFLGGIDDRNCHRRVRPQVSTVEGTWVREEKQSQVLRVAEVGLVDVGMIVRTDRCHRAEEVRREQA